LEQCVCNDGCKFNIGPFTQTSIKGLTKNTKIQLQGHFHGDLFMITFFTIYGRMVCILINMQIAHQKPKYRQTETQNKGSDWGKNKEQETPIFTGCYDWLSILPNLEKFKSLIYSRLQNQTIIKTCHLKCNFFLWIERSYC